MTEEEKAAAELAAANSNDATEINEDDLLAAVSAAVDEQTITPEGDTDDDDTSTDDDADLDAGSVEADGKPGADDDAGNEEDEEAGEPGDEEVDGDDSEAGDVDGGDGSADDDGDAATGDKPADGDDDADDADHVNDPIPESTNEKTATRIKSLIGLVKESNAATEQRDEIIEQINATGADPDQYANTLGFLKMYNSADPAMRKQALAVARGMVKELALDLGEGASVTQLSDHDDLQAEVEAGTLTETRAMEIAATRERQALVDARTTADDEAVATENQTQQNIAVGKKQLDDLETGLRTSEKSYAALRPMFIGLLKPVLRRTHPSEWGQAAREVFDQVKLANPAAAVPKPKPKPRNTPLRPTQGAGGGADKSVEGGDAVDAVNEALANM